MPLYPVHSSSNVKALFLSAGELSVLFPAGAYSYRAERAEEILTAILLSDSIGKAVNALLVKAGLPYRRLSNDETLAIFYPAEVTE